MSYILDALKKADQEHDLGTVPGLSTPQEPTAHRERRSLPWPWIIAALLLVNVLLVAGLMLGKGGQEPQQTIAGQAAPAPQERPAIDQATPPAAPPVQRLQVPAEALAVEAAPRVQPEYPSSLPAATGGEVVVLPGPGELGEPRSLAFPEQDTGVRVDITAVVDDHAGLQNWFELPPAFRSQLDLPRLDVHVYSEDPQQRFILVNLEKFREGETLESGMLLEEILPDGMVMSFRGERFRVKK